MGHRADALRCAMASLVHLPGTWDVYRGHYVELDFNIIASLKVMIVNWDITLQPALVQASLNMEHFSVRSSGSLETPGRVSPCEQEFGSVFTGRSPCARCQEVLGVQTSVPQFQGP